MARVGERRGAYKFWWGKSVGGRSLGRPRRRWEDNIKMYFLEVGWGMDLIDLAQDRDRCDAVVKEVMNFLVP